MYKYIFYFFIFILSFSYKVNSMELTDSYSAIGALFNKKKLVLVFSKPENSFSTEYVEFLNGKIEVVKADNVKTEDITTYGELFKKVENNYLRAIELLAKDNNSDEVLWKEGEEDGISWKVYIANPSLGSINSYVVINNKYKYEIEYSLVNEVLVFLSNGREQILLVSESCGAVSCSTDLYLYQN